MFCCIKYGCYSKNLLIIKKSKVVKFVSINDLFVIRKLLVYLNFL